MCAPYGVQARAPTTATERSAQSRRSGRPPHPEADRPGVTQVVELAGPFPVAGADESAAHRGDGRQIPLGLHGPGP